MSLLCENQTDWVTDDYYVCTLNYILDIKISYYKLERGKQVNN